MKKIICLISVLLAITFTFSSCTFSLTPETVERFVSNISNTEQQVTALTEQYNGRQNYYYSSLPDDEKIEYTKIYNAYMQFENFTVKVTENELSEMFNYVLYDNPEIFWVDSTYTFSETDSGIYVEPHYRLTAEEIKTKKIELNAEISRIISLAHSENSDYGKEKYFHDYICKNTVYDLSTYEYFGDSAYSALIDGKAICEGYARALKMLLDSIGIYNYLVVGKTENEVGKIEGHMWNIVSIGGETYHIDVTWDDSDGELGEISYLYFNLTDEDICKDHFEIIPSQNNCVSEKYNYFTVNGLYFSSFNNFNGMTFACANGITDDLIVEMRFANDSDYNKIKTLADNNSFDSSFYDFTVEVARASGMDLISDSYVYDDNYNYMCIVFEKG